MQKKKEKNALQLLEDLCVLNSTLIEMSKTLEAKIYLIKAISMNGASIADTFFLGESSGKAIN